MISFFRLLTAEMLVSFAFMALPSAAADVVTKTKFVAIGDVLYSFSYDKVAHGATAVSTKNNNYSSADIVIPASITVTFTSTDDGTEKTEETPVNAIGDFFIGFDAPDSLRDYGWDRYVPSRGDNFATVRSLHIPSSVTTISKSAFGLSTSIESVTVDEDSKYFTVSDGALYSKDMTKIIYYPAKRAIPDSTFTVPASVTTIGASAFHNLSLRTLNVHKNVTTFEDGGTQAGMSYGTFDHCYNLRTVTFESGSALTRIGSYAFDKDTCLNYIRFPEGLKQIGYESFRDCDHITEFVFPSSLTTIESYAFRFCEGITQVVIPENVTSMGEEAFYNCTNLKKLVIKSPVLQGISRMCFDNDPLTEVELAEGIKWIDVSAFEECKKLESIRLPSTVTSIGDYAFKECERLKSIDFGDKLQTIGREAFSGCKSLTAADLPSTVTRINSGAFRGCTGLTTFTVPGSTKSIGAGVFMGCTSISAFSVKDGNTAMMTVDGVLFDHDAPARLLAYPAASTRDVAYVVPRSITLSGTTVDVKKIEEGAFYGSSLSHITLPSGLETIGSGAFEMCSKMTELTVPASVTSVSSRGYVSENFIQNSGIKSLYCLPSTPPSAREIPNNVTVYLKKSVYDSNKYQQGSSPWKGLRYAYDIPATMTSGGLKSLGRDFDVDLSATDGVTAWIAAGLEDEQNVRMEQIQVNGMTDGKYIPSRSGTYTSGSAVYENYTGALLRGTPGSAFTYRIGEGSGMKLTQASNYLVPVTDDSYITPTAEKNGIEYTNLGLSGGKFRYYSAAGTVHYNRSYLSLPSSLVSGASRSGLTFSFGESVTGIGGAEVTRPSDTDCGVWYTVDGMRLAKPSRGIYIRGGKKVIVR